jgi:Xaa-Pro aminopeptidase
MNYSQRQKMFKELFSQNEKCDAVLVTDSSNVRYLCGFSGSCGYILATRNKTYFFTDFRYQEQSEQEVGDNANIIVFKDSFLKTVFKKIKACKVKKLGIERSLSVNTFLKLQEEFDGKVAPVSDHIRIQRRIKEKEELKMLKKAFKIADHAFGELMNKIKVGQTEVEVAALLEYFMKSNGSEMPSFSTIVASGPNSSCPHAQPTNRKIKNGDMVKIDFGAVYKGYHSDMTRTIFIGKATDKFKKIYNIVHKAQSEAIKALRVKAKCSDIDKIARNIITDAGYGDNFGHGLGHSFGLEVHESPSLSKKCEDIIEPGMTFTVEPGIYLPGWGGIRIEDSFMVEENKLVKLTRTPSAIYEVKP